MPLLLVLLAGSGILSLPRTGAAWQDDRPISARMRAELERWYDRQPKKDVPIPADGARVLVVKFSDYQCPACRVTHEEFKRVLGKYAGGGQVKFVLKHFPLESECNPSVTAVKHVASCEAAAAVIMARSKGAAGKLEEWLFTNQTILSPAVVRQAAKDVGGITDFDTRYGRALEEVKADLRLAALVGVGSTPTFLINGRKVVDVPTAQVFDALIEIALQRSK
jgi:protein-disulfide isomerase